MMNLEKCTEGNVWIWLSGQQNPTFVGKILQQDNLYTFKYDQNYLSNPLAIALSPFELPLDSKLFIPTGMNTIHSCLRDGAPDAWGRRVINNELNVLEANELAYMLISGSNRIGALDFQESNTHYIARNEDHVGLEQLMLAASYIEQNIPLPKELHNVLLHGTSIGGARPKALINHIHGNKQYIAKFSLNSDINNIIKFEYVGMRLAKLAGINVANVEIRNVMGKDVLLVERFDREIKSKATTRKFMLSGLSILGLNEMEARYASYTDLAEVIRMKFTDAESNLLELYKRLAFNVLIGNNDDHARNHSAFWNGENLTLTPAYDLCPQPRIGTIATQAMLINGKEGNLSKLSNVLSVADKFQLDKDQALAVHADLIDSIKSNWSQVCTEAKLTKLEQDQLWGKSIFNPFSIELK